MNVLDLQTLDADWPAVLGALREKMHLVDRDACSIWMQFFPLSLHELVDRSTDDSLRGFYKFRGTYRLSEIVDTSHWFLFGHRYWGEVKRALGEVAGGDLETIIRSVAAGVDAPMEIALPIAAVGLMTLRQVGEAMFAPSPASARIETRTAEQVLAARGKDRKTGWFAKPKQQVVMAEGEAEGWFPLIPGQHITTAAQFDQRPHHVRNPRCTAGNGAIPVDCRTGTCGTCWVGVLGGNENLSPVEGHERKRMEYFGYWESPVHDRDDSRPLIRLSCQVVAQGSCSIVVPPWNGIWSASRREAFRRQQGY